MRGHIKNTFPKDHNQHLIIIKVIVKRLISFHGYLDTSNSHCKVISVDQNPIKAPITDLLFGKKWERPGIL